MAESAREIDLDPRKYVGLSFPLRSDSNNDFALTRNSLQQAAHNLKNLLLTYPGERLGQPEFGSKLRAICFELNDNTLPIQIETELRRAVSIWLPYIEIKNVEVLTDEVNLNQIFVSLTYATNLDSMATEALTINVGTTPGATTDY
jgi:phage baseplate assembly protein W|tara:strand:- start:124 stop:561 length:438 start_codon:yes stop_codon:yes gene_type:complete